MTQGQEKLQQLMKYLGGNIPTLASCLDIEKQRLYDIQSGKTKKLSFELALIIHNVYNEINVEWLLGQSDVMIMFPNDTTVAPTGNPFFENFSVQGGYGKGNGSEQAILPDGYMSVPGINPTTDIPFIKVRGKSMLNPKDPEHSIPPGAWIAVKRVEGGAIRWGEVYAMETVDGPIVKRLMPSEAEDCVKCVSFNEDYPPFDLPTRDIMGGTLYLVKGVVNVQIWN